MTLRECMEAEDYPPSEIAAPQHGETPSPEYRVLHMLCEDQEARISELKSELAESQARLAAAERERDEAVRREREAILSQFEAAFKNGIKQAEDVYAEAAANQEYGPACVAEGYKDAMTQLLTNTIRARSEGGQIDAALGKGEAG